MQSGPNSRFLRDFFAQNGAFVQDFVRAIYFLDGLTRNFGAGTRNSEPRNSFFGAWNFYFGARTEKSRYRNFFAAASGPFFFPVGTFSRTRFPCHFVGGIPDGLSRRPGFCAGSVPCSVKRAGLEGIPRHLDFRMARVAAFFPRSPGPAPNTRISEGENEQIVNAHPNVHFVNIGGAAGMPPPTNSYRAQYKSPLNFYCPLFSLKKKRFSYSAGAESHKLYLYLQPEAFLRTKTDKPKCIT